MTKRSVQNDIESLGEDVLRDLDPGDRLSLIIQSQADGKDAWTERLHETTPRHTYRMKDVEVTNRVRCAFILAQVAAYELRTAWLRYYWMLSDSTHEKISDLFDLPTQSDYLEDDEQVNYDAQVVNKVTEMYVGYHSHSRFAEDVLGVDLETWLTSMHPEGEMIVPGVENVLMMEQHSVEQVSEQLSEVAESLNESTSDSEYATSLEDVIETEYEVLCGTWTDMVADGDTLESVGAA